MTVDVDTETYYAVGGRLFELAGEVYEAFAVNVQILGGTGAMAGTDDAGTAWAMSYDGRVREVLGAVNDLTVALQNYGGVVIQAGYNHAVAEYNAAGSQGATPHRPPEPASTAGVLSAPPSAGGPGRGLIDEALGLAEQVGLPVPDGDTVKVDTAAQAWDRLATVYQTVTVVEALEVNARAFSETQSPEVEFIVRDLGELRDATAAVLDGCRELAQSCKDYREALDGLRDQLEGILTDLAIELAVTATITVFAACVSFGAGAVAGAAKTAHTVSKFAKIIRSAVGAWKVSKRISEGVKKAHDIAGVRKRLERIKSLRRKGKPEDTPSQTRVIGDSGAAQLSRRSVDDKLERYLLNPDHAKGGSKAAWFEEALGFTRENADDLARQIVFDESNAIKTGSTAYGTTYNQSISITGANGKSIDVVFGWMRGEDGVVRLVTAIPTRR